MNIKDLKVRDNVFIREDLWIGKRYGSAYFVKGMKHGVQRIRFIDRDEKGFAIIESSSFRYTPEMIDWDKTRDLKINESWENVKRTISGGSKFKEISQSGKSGNETTKAIGYDLREITVKNNGEENDIEKAVMLLMLKQNGFTYGDVKREVEKVKVKWVPQLDEKYYYINTSGKVDFIYWKGHSIDTGRLEFNNCFETRKEAEEKLEKMKEILKGE